MSQKGKIESGAELLARLGPRPSLSGLTAWAVLGLEPRPGDILELYGGEGVGKTELLLHLVSSTLLSPHCGRGCLGKKPEVIWVDCDLKFSVLRLAVLLEQRLTEKPRVSHCERCCPVSFSSRSAAPTGDSVVGSGTENATSCDLNDGGNTERSSECGVLNSKDAERAEGDGCCGGNRGRGAQSCLHATTAESVDHRPGLKQDGIGFGGEKERGKTARDSEQKSFRASFRAQENIQSETHSSAKPDSSSKPGSFLLEQESTQGMTPCGELSQLYSLTRKRKAGGDMERGDTASHLSDGDVCDRYHSETTTCNKPAPSVGHTATAVQSSSEKGGTECPGCAEGSEVSGEEEVEGKVEECLQRVQVLRCLSSPQLLCTLHSLLPRIAANRNIALLVIDPASAFFWSDRCGGDFHQGSAYLQKTMTQAASLLKEIATTYGVFVVTTKQALVRSRNREKAADGFLSPGKGVPGEDSPVEFLGREWGRVVTHRLVCGKSVRGGGRTTHYTVSGNNTGQRSFTVGEIGVQILHR